MNFDHILGLGGIAAVVTAGWAHVRAAFGYIASVVVVTATYREGVGWNMQRYLKSHWRPLPNGHLIYVGKYFEWVRGRQSGSWVLFHGRPPSGVFMRGHQFVTYAWDGSGTVTLRSLRGLVDFDALAIAASDYNHKLEWATYEKDQETENRFAVHRIVGEEKNMGAFAAAIGQKVGRAEHHITGESKGPLADSSGQVFVDIDPIVDRSFQFAQSDYRHSMAESDPLEGLFFSNHVLKQLERAKRWRSMSKWYRDRGIPWRGGVLLHGLPGTGKSSFAKALAQMMRVPIYQFQLETLSDREFIGAWENMETPCVALLEELDTTFHMREAQTEHKALSFSCVANQISGVSARDGIFLVVTTNHLDKIDPAMGVCVEKNGISTRPGRIDTVIEIGLIDEPNRRRMAGRILADLPVDVHKVVAAGDGMTPGQFQELCIQRVYDLLAAEDAAPATTPKGIAAAQRRDSFWETMRNHAVDEQLRELSDKERRAIVGPFCSSDSPEAANQ